MTTINEAKDAIYKQFRSGWGATTAILQQNDANKPPDNDSWVRLSVKNTDSNQETLGKIGNRKYNRAGSVFVQIFVLSNQGTSAADILASLAVTILEGTKTTPNVVNLNDSVVREQGTDGKWFSVLVETFFFYEEIK